MNKIIDLRTTGFDVQSVQMNRRAMTRLAYLHGLIRAGVCDFVRERVKTLLLDRGILTADPELDLRAQRLERMDPQEAAYMLSGVAARCDYIISLPFSEPIESNGLTESVTRELRQLGLTTYLWPDYGIGGPSMNPGYADPREQEALSRISTWQPDPVGFAGVLTPGCHGHGTCNSGPCANTASPMPMQAGVGRTVLMSNREAEREQRRAEKLRRTEPAKTDPRQDGAAPVGYGESRQAG